MTGHVGPKTDPPALCNQTDDILPITRAALAASKNNPQRERPHISSFLSTPFFKNFSVMFLSYLQALPQQYLNLRIQMSLFGFPAVNQILHQHLEHFSSLFFNLAVDRRRHNAFFQQFQDLRIGLNSRFSFCAFSVTLSKIFIQPFHLRHHDQLFPSFSASSEFSETAE